MFILYITCASNSFSCIFPWLFYVFHKPHWLLTLLWKGARQINLTTRLCSLRWTNSSTDWCLFSFPSLMWCHHVGSTFHALHDQMNVGSDKHTFWGYFTQIVHAATCHCQAMISSLNSMQTRLALNLYVACTYNIIFKGKLKGSFNTITVEIKTSL